MMNRLSRQQGGTFLGLVIGLVMGIGLALAVAVYVTKVPVPFVNKGTTRNVEQDAVEARKNKDWDPNVLIQGKNPVRSSSGAVNDAAADKGSTSDKAPAAPSAPAKVEAKAEARPDAKVDSKPEAKAESRPDNKADVAKTEPKIDIKPPVAKPEPRKEPGPSADPLGELAKAKSSGTSADPFTYMVQTGAFKGQEEAETQRAKLALSGVEAKVTEREQSGRTVFRVRSGPYERREEAEKLKERLETAGYEAVLVRIQR